MQNFLQYKFLDNTIESYLIVAGIILLLYIVRKIIARFIAGWIFKLLAHKKNHIQQKEHSIGKIIKLINRFIFVFFSYTALDTTLYFPNVLKFTFYHHHINSEYIVNLIAVIIIVNALIRLCIGITGFIADVLQEKAISINDKADNQLIIFFNDFIRVVLIIIGILLIIQFGFDKPLGPILTGLSIAGAAVALAAKESLENLIASFIIFFDKPFTTGDVVNVQNFTGEIEKIGLRSTRIRTNQKTYISVPNKQMVDTIVDNITLRTQRKVELRLELSLSTTAQQLQQLSTEIKNILNGKQDIESSFVLLNDTGKNAHIISIDYFTKMPQPIHEFNSLKADINISIIQLLEKENIQLAAQSSDVVVTNK
jgi:MscS family membrane protein